MFELSVILLVLTGIAFYLFLSYKVANSKWFDKYCMSGSSSIERPISTIGFIAKVPLKDEPRDSYLIEEKHCSWRLGLGSCGRVAKSLQLKYVGDMLVIIQTCEDGDYKEFHYKISDIVGRITISYKSDS